MKINTVHLILEVVLLVAACGPLPEKTTIANPPTPSVPLVTPALNSDSIASQSAQATWQTYTNPQVGFSIQYPVTWQLEVLPDENDGQLHRIVLNGDEGGVELQWGIGVGGACPDYQPVQIAQGTLPACRSIRADGTELWSLAGQPVGEIGFGGFIYTNNTAATSRAIVFQVVSTLRLP